MLIKKRSDKHPATSLEKSIDIIFTENSSVVVRVQTTNKRRNINFYLYYKGYNSISS